MGVSGTCPPFLAPRSAIGGDRTLLDGKPPCLGMPVTAEENKRGKLITT